MSRVLKLSEIKISQSFAETTPKAEKLEKCRKYYDTYQRQDRPIVVDHTNTLIDGYIMYLVLQERNVKDAKIKISTLQNEDELTSYVYGVHPNCKCAKEFLWRIPKSWYSFADRLQIGDTIFCDTKFGIAPMIVTKIEQLKDAPIDIKVKRVAYGRILRDGEAIL